MSTSFFPPDGPAPAPAPPATIGRIPVVDVFPVIEGGRWPAKAVVGEVIPVRATVFRDGHEHVGGSVVLIDPRGEERPPVSMREIAPGLDVWQARVAPDVEGRWRFRVEGWSNPYSTWRKDASVKIDAGVDVEVMLTEGALLLRRAAEQPGLPARAITALLDGAAGLDDDARPAHARLAAGIDPSIGEIFREFPLRDLLSASAEYPLIVHRKEALFASWYEFFPRSEGAHQREDGTWVSGTFSTAAKRLPGIAKMGFDVVYLTPIHPVGRTHRKGRNNTLTALPGDPGSPYGIGSPAGGHDATHPDLGTKKDFASFVARARELGMEVALDIALQASPDHPWVAEHPDWFTIRADGSIAYAENPPKKYQDIYPVNFDTDPEGIYAEIHRILQEWIDLGVTAFRVDNPHTKPLPFWERLLADIAAEHPDVLFLSEAFTKPAMMKTLATIGFHQSYTYFTWRNSKEEVADYLVEVSGDQAAVMRPSFWPTTHDILTPYMQQGGVPAFAIRAILAATGSPLWGIYSGYEFAESVARPGAEEQIDNEKYEYRPRDWEAAKEIGISDLLTRLNTIRREHPALHQLRNLTVQHSSNEAILAFSKHLPARFHPEGHNETIIVILTLDPFTEREGMVFFDMAALGLSEDAAFEARDLLGGEVYTWSREAFVRLHPHHTAAHIVSVRPIGGSSWLT
ncbi:MAG TPA: alpha-1,4-glucan--maltose-1-phosphate maltosyltransferase [Beutenbergiaceae bacterium]|nr:alpha-1,4-glucan--maltose-1-phosphate maltosyltransferase [Beutenbergiaceae bacterium]